MTKFAKLLEIILRGSSDANISFSDLCQLLEWLGFSKRIRGSHYVFSMEGVEEIINIQSRSGKAKPYQVKQVRGLILKYKMGEGNV